MPSKKATIQASLSTFLQGNNTEPPEGTIDDIVLDYVVSIIEELGSEDDIEGAFDVDDFSEMMEAYIPGFGSIESALVSDWVVLLAEKLRSGRTLSNGADLLTNELISQLSLSPPSNELPSKAVPIGPRKNSRKTSGSQSGDESQSSPRPRGDCAFPVCDTQHETDLLREMFPGASLLEINHCLCVAKGGIDDAIQLILHRQDMGEAIKESHQTHCATSLNEDQMKESILHKYSYVDTADDRRQHRPSMALQAKSGQKLIRYLDSKVVSTKGERFTEIKRDDDVDPKKFNINLKPAKQYRFH